MTKQEASERYQIPMHILSEYESWGLCGAVKEVMGAWQYDDTDLERLSTILTLHDLGLYHIGGGDLYAPAPGAAPHGGATTQNAGGKAHSCSG